MVKQIHESHRLKSLGLTQDGKLIERHEERRLDRADSLEGIVTGKELGDPPLNVEEEKKFNETVEKPADKKAQEQIIAECKADKAKCESLIQRTHIMDIKFMYDENLLKRFKTQSNAEYNLKEMVTHLQALFCDRSFGSRIHVNPTFQYIGFGDKPLFLNSTGWKNAYIHHEKDPDRISKKYDVYSYI